MTNWRITDFNDACEIEPALIGIYDLPVGSDLQVVVDKRGKRIVETPTGRELNPNRCTSPQTSDADPLTRSVSGMT